nr:zinc finger, CCHC-type [Tanacetum cinerariifolium]
MGDENPIRTLGDYSKPSHGGYRNTIELPVGNNVVPLRSDTIRLVQNKCSFHGLRSEDPIQHLKDFLKLVDSLHLDGSTTTWEDLTTRFLAQFFPSRRTTKLRNDILIGPHDTQYCMKNPEQAFVDYASSRTDKAGCKWYDFKPEPNNLGDTYNPSWRSHPNLRWRQPQNSQRLVFNFMASQDARLSKFEADFKQQQSEMTNKIDTVLKAITDRITDALPRPRTSLLVGRRFLATANAVIDCKMTKIAVGEGITRSVFKVKGVNLGEEEPPYWTTLGKRESYKPRPSSDGVGARTPYYARRDFLDCHLPR